MTITAKGLMGHYTSVLNQKFDEEVDVLSVVVPAKAGIQTHAISWIPARARSAGLAGMTAGHMSR
ncbi:MAG: hypothetical protein K8F29_02570, partial [Kofleriaceae bacterium]|nr:hypothetical protein [Candidatus Methylomirabilis lanthanidiphila]